MIRRILFLVTLGVLGAWVIRHYFVEGIYIASASMEPTLLVGRHVFVSKRAYLGSSPRRGDVVMVKSSAEEKEVIKRVIGLPGEDMLIRDKKIYINGIELKEVYVRHTRPDELLQGDNMHLGVIPRDHVVVLGDNRDESGDSRDWKNPHTGKPAPFIPFSDIRGKLMGVD